MIDILLRTTIVLTVAALMSLIWRRNTASAQHALWGLCFLSVVLVSLFSLVRSTPLVLTLNGPGGWLLLFWAVGAMGMTLRAGLAWVSLLLLTLRSRPLETPGWTELIDEASASVGYRRPVEVRIAPENVGPVVRGWLHPTILLPNEAATWGPIELRMALCHEIHHVRAWNRVLDAAVESGAALHWYHPLAWYGLRRFRIERARAADGAAVAPESTSEYVDYLLRRARTSRAGGILRTPLTQTQPADLEARLVRLMDISTPTTRTLSPLKQWASALALLVATIALVGFVRIPGGSETPPTLVVDGSGYLPVRIEGVLRADASGEPVAGASVRLVPTVRPSENPPLDRKFSWGVFLTPDGDREPYETVTDAEGRFAVENVIPGPYWAETAARAFLPVAAPGGSTVLNVHTDGTLEPRVIRMSPVATVSGAVYGPGGRPLPHMNITALQVAHTGGRPGLKQTRLRTGPPILQTDSDGRFSVGLAPGQYYLATNHILRPPSRFPASPEWVPHLGRVYYPDAYLPWEATPIHVEAGRDLAGIDLRYPGEELYTVRMDIGFDPIAVVRPPSPIRMRATPGDSTATLPFEDEPRPGFENLNDDPNWSAGFDRVAMGGGVSPLLPRGHYEFRVSVPSSDGRHLLTSELVVNVEDTDLAYTTALRPPVALEGQIRLEGTADTEVDYTEILLASRLFWEASARQDIVAVRLNGSFALDMPQGRSGIWIGSLPEDLYLVAATLDGADMLDRGVEISGDTEGPVDLVLAPGGGIVTGVLRNPEGDRLPGARVVLIDADGRRGGLGEFLFDYTDIDGSFRIGSVPPGDYDVLAVANELVAYPTDAILDRVRPELTRVRATPGEVANVEPVLADPFIDALR